MANNMPAHRVAASAVAMDWQVGQTILDLYEVKSIKEGAARHYAEGGMGRVYRVHHKGWNVDLAAKVPLTSSFQNDLQKENFRNECETWVNLGLHPHTVSCHYVRPLGDVPVVFAEFVEGGSLHDWIHSRKLYEGGPEAALKRILDIAIQFAWGLHYAHEEPQESKPGLIKPVIIHQDVKPANVMMMFEGMAKVTDFGLANARVAIGAGAAESRPGQSLVVPGAGLMTKEYASPEQIGRQALTRRTDLWSWAVSVYEMLIGGRNWLSGLAVPELLASYFEEEHREAHLPTMPIGLAEVLHHCLQNNPQDRPRDMREVAGELIALYGEHAQEEYSRKEPKAVEMAADSLNNRGLSLLDLGKADQALAVWDEVLKQHPGHWETTFNRSVQLWKQAKMTDQELVGRLKESRTMRMDDWAAAYDLGLLQMSRYDIDSASAVLSEAARLGGGHLAEPALRRIAEIPLKGVRRVSTSGKYQKALNEVAMDGEGQWGLSCGYHENTAAEVVPLIVEGWEAATGHDITRPFAG